MATVTPEIFDTSGIRLNKDAFIVIVRSVWNDKNVDILEEGCIKILAEKNVRCKIIEVPGVFEITFAIKRYWDKNGSIELPDAFIALGCVIRGDTPHFEYVCNAITQGILQLNLLLPVPTIFGILTVNDQVQADERSGGSHGHKGQEAAATALKMISFSQSL